METEVAAPGGGAGSAWAMKIRARTTGAPVGSVTVPLAEPGVAAAWRGRIERNAHRTPGNRLKRVLCGTLMSECKQVFNEKYLRGGDL